MSNLKYLRDPSLLVKKLRWQALYRGPRRDVTVETENGLLTFDSRDKLIGKHLFMDRAYETQHIRRAILLLRDEGWLSRETEGTVLDVGANIGMICIALLRFGYFERAVAFEPGPENYRLLTHNIRQNELSDRVRALPYALSSTDDRMELELSDYNSGDHRIRQTMERGAFNESARETVAVSVHTLDGLLQDDAVCLSSDVKLVWMDIQGHEGHFFEGARKFFTWHAVPVVSEFWPYGLARAGFTQERYVAITSSLFTHFYARSGERFEKRPIERIAELFAQFPGPKQVSEVILVRES